MSEFRTIAGDVVDFDEAPRDVVSLPAEVLGDLLAAAAIAAGALDAAAEILRAEGRTAISSDVKGAGVRLDNALRAAHDVVQVDLDDEVPE